MRMIKGNTSDKYWEFMLETPKIPLIRKLVEGIINCKSQ